VFIQKNFDENDARGRQKAKEILSARFDVKDNPDKYGIDLLCYRNGILKYYVEVEVKNLWTGQDFHWNTINVPIRKEKFFKQHENVMYIMFNSDLSSCFIVSNQTILASKKEEVPNRRHASGEYFFKVPYEKVFHHRNI
jgi:hypothetical protein